MACEFSARRRLVGGGQDAPGRGEPGLGPVIGDRQHAVGRTVQELGAVIGIGEQRARLRGGPIEHGGQPIERAGLPGGLDLLLGQGRGEQQRPEQGRQNDQGAHHDARSSQRARQALDRRENGGGIGPDQECLGVAPPAHLIEGERQEGEQRERDRRPEATGRSGAPAQQYAEEGHCKQGDAEHPDHPPQRLAQPTGREQINADERLKLEDLVQACALVERVNCAEWAVAQVREEHNHEDANGRDPDHGHGQAPDRRRRPGRGRGGGARTEGGRIRIAAGGGERAGA
ncbi:MAG TPA: hypothetical protein VK001_03495 [Geminicoccaceae bacterium]|nr:hypothetical protein [Geminicoccaceae bacterium]